MSKLTAVVCALVIGSILVGCSCLAPQRTVTDATYYKDGRG